MHERAVLHPSSPLADQYQRQIRFEGRFRTKQALCGTRLKSLLAGTHQYLEIYQF